jgi:integrase
MRKAAALSHRRIENATAPPGKRRRLSDWPASPLYLVVSGPPSHVKSWVSRQRVAGRQQTLTYGMFPAVPLQLARQRAQAVERALAAGISELPRLRAIARGADPDQAPLHPPDRFEVVAAEFIVRYLRARHRAPAYVLAVERRFRNHVLPGFTGRDIRSITRREVVALLDRVHDDAGPEAANLTLAALRSLFRWANQRDLVDVVPTSGIVAPGETAKRDRVLDDVELAAVMRAARRLGYPFGIFVQLLVLTGLRRGEAAGLRWADIDLAGGIIAIPAERMKGRRAHMVPLTPAVIALLDHCPRQGPFVLRANGSKPLTSFIWAKQQIDRLTVGTAPWRLHDLRRSCATGMARLGIQRFVIARVLAHADREVTGVYDRYEYLPEKRAALERWAAHVTGLLRPQPVETAHVP